MFLRRTPIVLALVVALAAPLAASADTTFTFTGHGYGHGVGMGQYGAQGYALQGWTHQQILAHYYQGTTLGSSPVTQVRVLLQEKLTQAAAGAPGGLTATDEGGSATLPIAGPSVVTVRRDASGFSLVDATGAVLASGWTGPVSLTATGGGPVTLSGAGLNGVRDGRYRGRLRVLAGAGRSGGRQRRHPRELPARRGRERDAVGLEARGAGGAGDRRAHLCRGHAQARVESVRPLSRPAQPGLPRARGRGRTVVGGCRCDRRPGRAVSGPADRHVLLVILGRADRSRPGVAPRRGSRSRTWSPSTTPSTRSRPTTTGRSRWTTATSRRRPSTRASSPACRSTPTRPGGSTR